MNRISVMSNGQYDGLWFDADKATKFEEESYWNGNNWISKATGSQTEHETLFLTASEEWIIYHSSQWQGNADYAVLIDADDAAKWFMRNEYKDEDIPEEIKKLLPKYEL